MSCGDRVIEAYIPIVVTFGLYCNEMDKYKYRSLNFTVFHVRSLAAIAHAFVQCFLPGWTCLLCGIGVYP